MLNRLVTYLFLFITAVVIIYGCANIGTLTGGEKDITPPEIESSKPAARTTNFTGKRITITGNEFIQLKDLKKNFVLSPPMKKAPSVMLRTNSKDLIVNFEEDFLPNTTYTLYFGNSIVDYNEGNPLRNYNFVFSTGNYIDSLSFLGRIYNSFDLTPQKDGMYIMLYPIVHDSVPRKMLPAFITKSNSRGWFKFEHIYADSFLVFGLKDANMNYLFDQAGEAIAFSDTLIIIDTSFYHPLDTLKPKVILKDSISPDSIDEYAGSKPLIEMYYFTEEIIRKQNLNDYSRNKNNFFTLVFENPVVGDSLFVDLLERQSDAKWWIRDNKQPDDTINFWITDTTVIKNDTLKLRIGYYTLDTMSRTFLLYDTISITLKQSPGAKNKKGPKPPLFSKLSFQTVVSTNNTLELNSKFYIDPDQPTRINNLRKIHLYKIEDSIKIPVRHTITTDSVLARRFYLNFTYEPDIQYELIVDTASFTSIYGIDNDSTGFSFKTRSDDYYSLINLNLKNSKGPTIVQLITTKGDVVKEKRITEDGLCTFNYVVPGKYGVKIIYDKNNNGIWDTGNWRKKLQPERVSYYPEEISIRSNFDSDITWDLP